MESTKTSYTAEFRTDIDFRARVLLGALAARRAEEGPRSLAESQVDELSFEHYSGAHSIVEIAIGDASRRRVVLWQDEDLRLRLAAGDLFDVLELCVECLSELTRLDDGTPSFSALDRGRAAIARAGGCDRLI